MQLSTEKTDSEKSEKKTSSEQLLPSANAEHQLVIPKQAADVMDQLIDLYDLDEDE